MNPAPDIAAMMNARTMWKSLGIAAMGCAFAGVALPLVPTTPFLLVAAFCFARGSPRLHAKLMEHRQFGPMIRDWREHGSLSLRVKVWSVIVIVATVAVSWLLGAGSTVILVQIGVLSCTTLFILTRPTTPERED